MHILGLELIESKSGLFKNLKKKGDSLVDGRVSNGWYPFCKYEYNSKDLTLDNETPPCEYDTTIKFPIPFDFYKNNEKDLNITVSCIVGKNGSGKSTLLEILYRIINNLAWAIIENDPFQEQSLVFSSGFSANLFFSLETDKEKDLYVEKLDM